MNLSIEELKALRALVKAYVKHQIDNNICDNGKHAELLGRLLGEIEDRENQNES